jgi:CheY-like chemotaxis protein
VPDDDHESERSLVHDLNNSLAAIVAFSQLIRTDPSLPEGLRQQATMLVQEADRTRQLVADLVGGATPTDAEITAPAGATAPATTAPATVAAAAPPPLARTEGDPGQASRPSRILVLDDEPAIRDFLGRILRRSGYEVMTASDGMSALEIVSNDPPDAILCDHRMAGMNGIDFYQAAAAIDAGLTRSFVFMSGDVQNTELRVFAAEHGVTLLAKPFDIDSVDRTVRGIVGPVQPVG